MGRLSPQQQARSPGCITSMTCSAREASKTATRSRTISAISGDGSDMFGPLGEGCCEGSADLGEVVTCRLGADAVRVVLVCHPLEELRRVRLRGVRHRGS